MGRSRYRDSVCIRRSAQKQNVSARIHLAWDNLCDGRVNGIRRIAFQREKLRKIRNGRRPCALAGRMDRRVVDQSRLNNGIADRAGVAVGEDTVVAEDIIREVADDQRTKRTSTTRNGVAAHGEGVKVTSRS